MRDFFFFNFCGPRLNADFSDEALVPLLLAPSDGPNLDRIFKTGGFLVLAYIKPDELIRIEGDATVVAVVPDFFGLAVNAATGGVAVDGADVVDVRAIDLLDDDDEVDGGDIGMWCEQQGLSGSNVRDEDGADSPVIEVG